MAKIVLEVDEKNLGSVITVLNSLKEGLVLNMEVNSLTQVDIEDKRKKFTRYQPKSNKVIYEEEQGKLESMGKYLDPTEFKKRLRKR